MPSEPNDFHLGFHVSAAYEYTGMRMSLVSFVVRNFPGARAALRAREARALFSLREDCCQSDVLAGSRLA